ncbi:hypothetical protein [Spiroplasma endosymbiont of Amphibalanus improvisus]|uniref:hypothetical protein n=1 Tax=Spiroplasma endosymbiont of Amphibalanus improvisus TaxID=3066327 RepID=UPI00313C45E6
MSNPINIKNSCEKLLILGNGINIHFNKKFDFNVWLDNFQDDAKFAEMIKKSFLLKSLNGLKNFLFDEWRRKFNYEFYNILLDQKFIHEISVKNSFEYMNVFNASKYIINELEENYKKNGSDFKDIYLPMIYYFDLNNFTINKGPSIIENGYYILDKKILYYLYENSEKLVHNEIINKYNSLLTKSKKIYQFSEGQINEFRSILLSQLKNNKSFDLGIEKFIQNLLKDVKENFQSFGTRFIDYENFKYIFNKLFHVCIINLSFEIINNDNYIQNYKKILDKFDYIYTLNYDVIIDFIKEKFSLTKISHLHGVYNFWDDETNLLVIDNDKIILDYIYADVLLKEEDTDNTKKYLDLFKKKYFIKKLYSDNFENINYEVSFFGVHPSSDEYIFDYLLKSKNLKKINYYYFNEYKNFDEDDVWKINSSEIKTIIQILKSSKFKLNFSKNEVEITNDKNNKIILKIYNSNELLSKNY